MMRLIAWIRGFGRSGGHKMGGEVMVQAKAAMGMRVRRFDPETGTYGAWEDKGTQFSKDIEIPRSVALGMGMEVRQHAS